MSGQNATSSDSTAYRAGPSELRRQDARHTANEVLRIAYQRWRVFFVGFSLAATAALAVSHGVPRRYTAVTIFERRDDVVVANLVQRNSPNSFDTIRRSLELDLKGPEAVTEALGQIGGSLGAQELPVAPRLPEDATSRRQVLASLVSEIELKLLEKSPHLDLIEVRCHGSDPVLVGRLANRLRDNYVRRVRERLASVLLDAKAFFEGEVARYQGLVEGLEGRVIRMESEFPGIDPGDPKSVYVQVSVLQTKHDDLQRTKLELQAKIRAREGFLNRYARRGRTDQTQPGGGVLAGERRIRLEDQIRDVEDQITDLKTVRCMTDEHPAVVALQRKFARLEAELAQTPIQADASQGEPVGSQYTGQEYLAWLSQRGAVQMEFQALQDILAATERELQDVAEQLGKLKHVQAEMADRRQVYRNHLAAMEQAKADLTVWQANLEQVARHLTAEQQERGIQFATLQVAQPVLKPVWPRVSMIFILSLAVGLAVAVGCVAMAELLDRSFRTAGHVGRSLGLPVLEGISEIVTPALHRRRLVMQMVVAPAVSLLLIAGLLLAGAATYWRLEGPGLQRLARGEPSRLVHEVKG